LIGVDVRVKLLINHANSQGYNTMANHQILRNRSALGFTYVAPFRN